MAEEITPAGESDEGATPETTDEPLGENGLKALKAERERVAAEKQRADELAARLKEIEDRDKTAEERAQQRLAEAEKRAAEVELRATRAEVAAASSVPVDILAGPKSGSAEDIQAFADALTAWRGEVPQPRGPVIPGQGTTPTKPRSAGAQAFAEALGL